MCFFLGGFILTEPCNDFERDPGQTTSDRCHLATTPPQCKIKKHRNKNRPRAPSKAGEASGAQLAGQQLIGSPLRGDWLQGTGRGCKRQAEGVGAAVLEGWVLLSPLNQAGFPSKGKQRPTFSSNIVLGFLEEREKTTFCPPTAQPCWHPASQRPRMEVPPWSKGRVMRVVSF